MQTQLTARDYQQRVQLTPTPLPLLLAIAANGHLSWTTTDGNFNGEIVGDYSQLVWQSNLAQHRVTYGLQSTNHDTPEEALAQFHSCLQHWVQGLVPTVPTVPTVPDQ